MTKGVRQLRFVKVESSSKDSQTVEARAIKCTPVYSEVSAFEDK